MRILTAAQMKCAEEAAVLAGGSFEQLMETAGQRVAEWMRELQEQHKFKKEALFLCGKGNNAGDAFVAARRLASEGWRARLLPVCGDQFSPLAGLNWGRLPGTVERLETGDLDAPILVDGVFGTGFRGPLPPQVAGVFEAANKKDALRLALDIPSGLVCDTGEVTAHCFAATHTVTFGAYKPGLLKEEAKAVVGEVRCVDIGV